MSRRFIVAVNTLTAEQEKQFAADLNNAGLDWWHWIQNFWLVIDRSNQYGAENIRNHLANIMPGRFSMIMEVEPTGNWAGFGPTGDQLSMSQWLEDSWLKGD